MSNTDPNDDRAWLERLERNPVLAFPGVFLTGAAIVAAVGIWSCIAGGAQ